MIETRVSLCPDMLEPLRVNKLCTTLYFVAILGYPWHLRWPLV